MDDMYHTSATFQSDDERRFDHAKFVLKTLDILFYQFLFTFACIALVTFYEPVFLLVRMNIENLLWISSIGSFVQIVYMSMIAKRHTIEQLSVFTILETILVCCATTLYGKDVVVMAMLSTLGITSGLAVYALTTKNNHIGLFGPLMSALTCLCLMGIVNLFVMSESLVTINLYFGTIVFLGYIVFDVQYFLSDKTGNISNHHRDDLHIVAAMNIYLDVINIFLRIMEIIDRNKSDGGKKNRK